MSCLQIILSGSQIVASIAIVITAIYAGCALRAQEKDSKSKLYMELLKKYHSSEMTQSRVCLKEFINFLENRSSTLGLPKKETYKRMIKFAEMFESTDEGCNFTIHRNTFKSYFQYLYSLQDRGYIKKDDVYSLVSDADLPLLFKIIRPMNWLLHKKIQIDENLEYKDYEDLSTGYFIDSCEEILNYYRDRGKSINIKCDEIINEYQNIITQK